MNDRIPNDPSASRQFEDVLAEFVQAVEQGLHPDPLSYLAKYPDCADRLREAFRNDAWFARLAPDLAPTSPCAAAADDSPALSVGSLVAGYVILEELGRGGRGVVYRVSDPELNRPLAVKVLRSGLRNEPDAVRRLLEESQVTSQLQHPGIVPVHAIGRLPDGRPYFAMKQVQGRTLAELLAERPTRAHDLSRFVSIFHQVCQAVAYAHSRGVIHRDLKPRNIMIGAFAEVQVMDWGFAKVLTLTVVSREPPQSEPGVLAPGDADTIRTVRTEATDETSEDGTVLGTVAYMSPEQARGQIEQLNERADVFGLGAVLCEVLTGLPPYAGVPAWELRQKAAAGDLADAFARLERCGADAELISLARDCLAPERERRPRDAAAVAERMATYLAEVQERLRRVELEKAAAEARAAGERKRRRLAVGLTAAVVALTLGVMAWAWQRWESIRLTEADLDRAARLLDEEQLPACREALERAEGRLGSGGPSELRRRAEELRDLLGVVRRLEQARLAEAGGVRDGHFDEVAKAEAYRQELARYGLGGEDVDEEDAARRISASPIKGLLVAALDNWAIGSPPVRQRRLLAIAGRVDTDRWRNRLREALARGDRAEAVRLVKEARPERLPPSTVELLAAVLNRYVGVDEVVRVLEASQRRHPGDFWVNQQLAIFLMHQKPPRPGEAVGYYRAALAARPDSPGTYLNLGAALLRQGRPKEAEAAFREAIRLKPDYPQAHTNLGLSLLQQGRPKEAEAAYREGIRLKPDYPEAHINLGAALLQQGRSNEAEATCREALRLKPDRPEVHTNLGALSALGRPKEAEAACREALRLKPDSPEAHCNLGDALRRQGRFEESLTSFKRGHELGSKQPGWRYPSAQWVHGAEYLVALDRSVAAVVNGHSPPPDAASCLTHVEFCQQYKKLPRAVARFYAAAFAAEPKLAAEPRSGHRYNAARAAALAAAGRGEDAIKLADEERARWRQQALDWLRADLAAWAKTLEAAKPEVRAAVRQTLQHWHKAPDLAGVRDKAELAKLADTEREPWAKLWADVEALRKRARETK
jgi:serine/threonine-protein kinase